MVDMMAKRAGGKTQDAKLKRQESSRKAARGNTAASTLGLEPKLFDGLPQPSQRTKCGRACRYKDVEEVYGVFWKKKVWAALAGVRRESEEGVGNVGVRREERA